jgi:iron complex outermembrane receptor protein
VHLIGSCTECGVGQIGDLCHPVSGIVYQDLSGGYSWRDTIAITVGVSNLTNRDPPFISNSGSDNTDPATYRLLGRPFFGDLRCTFC